MVNYCEERVKIWWSGKYGQQSSSWNFCNHKLCPQCFIDAHLVLAAILWTRSLRSVPSIVFLCSLAIPDLLVGLVVQRIYIACQCTYQWQFSVSRKKLVVSLLFGICTDSHKRGSVFGSSLSHAWHVFSHNDHKTCNIYFSRSMVCLYPVIVP